MSSYSTVLTPIPLHTFAGMYQVYQGNISLNTQTISKKVSEIGGAAHGFDVCFTSCFTRIHKMYQYNKSLTTLSGPHASAPEGIMRDLHCLRGPLGMVAPYESTEACQLQCVKAQKGDTRMSHRAYLARAMDSNTAFRPRARKGECLLDR